MALRNGSIACLCTAVVVFSGFSAADGCRADDFLGLDLSKAVLSPKPLGPASGFVQGPLRLTADRGGNRAQTKPDPTAHPKAAVSGAPSAHAGVQPPRLLARTRTAHHHRSPLDAQASDSPTKVWPCKSGGICSWKR
jgi:hypothetical protein